MDKTNLRPDQIAFISNSYIFNEIDTEKALIFDFRTKKQFQESSIHKYSINIPYDEIDANILDDPNIFKNNSLAKFAHTDFLVEYLKSSMRRFIVIIMSEDKISKDYIYKNMSLIQQKDSSVFNDLIMKPLLFYKNLMIIKKREFGLFQKGFSSFRFSFPFMLSCNNLAPEIL